MSATLQHAGRSDVDAVIEMAGRLPPKRRQPRLAMLVGAPGTGKSTMAAALRARTGIAVIESDAVRAAMFEAPTYAKAESAAVFDAVHGAVRKLLRRGVSVLVDATNLIESERGVMYDIAREAGARLIVVRLTAPAAVVRKRLAGRPPGGVQAGEAVFERMMRMRQPVGVPHYVVDTTGDTGPAVMAVAREIVAR